MTSIPPILQNPAPDSLLHDTSDDSGPFDIIGDVHGCCDELELLLGKLGYEVRFSGQGDKRACTVQIPPGRRAVFVGDLVDRGPRTPDVLRLVMAMTARSQAYCVMGNHDQKFLRWIIGRDVSMTHGLDDSVEQMGRESGAFRDLVRGFLEQAPVYCLLDKGRLAITHAGIRQDMIGTMSNAVRAFCLYGDTTGEMDEYGLPVRLNWAKSYQGDTRIIYGHVPSTDAKWVNNTLCLDTGCVFGNALSALRYPEFEVVSVPAARTYASRKRPLEDPGAKS